MRRGRFLPGLFLLLIVGTFLLPAPLHAIPRVGQQAPNFKVVTTSGQTVSLENYRDRVLIVDFFATWCVPCRESVPHLVELNRKFGKQGLQVLGLSADEDGEQLVKAFAAANHVNYPLAMSSEAIQTDYGIRSVPVMFVIDKKGRIAEMYRGSPTGSENRWSS